MIISRHRFHGLGSLKPVYSRGQNVRGGLLSVRFSRRSSDRPYRVAVVVSRKVSKSAVVRNRIRRRIYEAVRQHSVPIPKGTDLVFTAYSEQLADLPAAKLQKLVIELLERCQSSSAD